MQIVSFAARHLTTELRNLDSQENTVLSRKAPLEGAASWRSETIVLAKLLSLAVDYLI